jgi:DNA modification methylase
MSVRILIGDVREQLRTLDADSIHCCVTSPPYWGLRDYGVDGQIGLESSPAAFIAVMVDVFEEVRRVLRPDGTCWINMGDSYATTATSAHQSRTHLTGGDDLNPAFRPGVPQGLKAKDLCMMPHRLAIALQDAGWWVRQDIVWSKPNPMPESVRDRCTKSHEYVFLLTKSDRYYFDQAAIAEPVAASSIARLAQDIENQVGSDRVPGKTNGNMKAVRSKRDSFKRDDSKRAVAIPNQSMGTHRPDRDESEYALDVRNKRSVWTIATQPYREAHFATFPPELPEVCIKAGTSERGHCPECGARWRREIARTFAPQSDVAIEKGVRGAGEQKPMDLSNTWDGFPRGTTTMSTMGWVPTCECGRVPVPDIVLDPFFGAGTTGLVSDRLQRDCIGIELNAAYAKIARKRIQSESPLFADIADIGPEPAKQEQASMFTEAP